MGAYENPETWIDTQTAQHYQNLQNTISGVASNYATAKRKELDDHKKKLEENQLAVDKGNLALYGALDKNTEKNKSIDWHSAYDPYIEEYANLNLTLLNGTSQNRADTLKRMSKISEAVNTSADTMVSLMSEYPKFETGVKQIGLPGGLSSIGNGEGTVNAYNVLTGKAKGGVKVILDPKTLVQSFVVSGEINGKTFTTPFDSTQLNKAANGAGVLNYNYDTSEQDDIMKIETGLFSSKKDKFGKDTGIPDVIDDKFFLSESVRTKEGVSQKKGSTTYIDSRKVNEQMVADTLKPKIDIQADGLLANPLSAVGTYHDVFNGSDATITADTLLANKHGEKDTFKKAYLDYVMRTIPKTRPILDENGNTVKIEIADKKPIKVGKAPVGQKPTASQINKKDFNADIANKIESGNGVVVGKGNTLVIENGIGRVVGKDGLDIDTGGETDPTILQGYVGGSARPKPKLKGIKK